jgi:hypothetical protein
VRCLGLGSRCVSGRRAAEGVCDGRQGRRPWMLAFVDRRPSDDGGGRPAVPVVYRGTDGRLGPVLFTLDVDGERFAIRRAGDGGTAYDWLSGPNKGYGFGSSGPPNRPVEEHRRLPRHDRSQYGLHRGRLRERPQAEEASRGRERRGLEVTGVLARVEAASGSRLRLAGLRPRTWSDRMLRRQSGPGYSR